MASAVLARAQALVRVAAAVADQAEALGAARPSTVLRSAAAAVVADPERTLPCRRLLIHGFADATGVGSDLIEALLLHRSGLVILDRPLDPVDGRDAAGSFSRSFVERLAGVSQREREETPRPPAAAVSALLAPDPEAEVRAVLERLATLLSSGTAAETIGVVARDLAPYGALLRRHADRLGVPLSGVAARLPGGAARGVCLALGELLAKGERSPTEVWLQAVAERLASGADLALGLRCLGAGRLLEVARLEPHGLPWEGLELPVLAGWSGDEERGGRSRRRRLSRRTIASWVRRARAACARAP